MSRRAARVPGQHPHGGRRISTESGRMASRSVRMICVNRMGIAEGNGSVRPWRGEEISQNKSPIFSRPKRSHDTSDARDASSEISDLLVKETPPLCPICADAPIVA